MKNYTIILLLVFFQNAFAQETEGNAPVEKNYFTTAEIDKKPEFPGGVDRMYAFIKENFKMPENKEIKGKLFINFIVETDGSIKDIKVMREIGGGSGKEAIRVVKKFPNWEPGEKDGKKVRTQYQMPIDIN